MLYYKQMVKYNSLVGLLYSDLLWETYFESEEDLKEEIS